MPDERPAAERSYHIGDVGTGARVAQGENISWVEGVSGLPDGESLKQQFSALLERIAKDGSLDEDTRALAEQKTKAVAEGLSRERSSLKVTSSPQSRLFSIAQGPRTASAKEKATVTRGAAYAFPDGLNKRENLATTAGRSGRRVPHSRAVKSSRLRSTASGVPVTFILCNALHQCIAIDVNLKLANLGATVEGEERRARQAHPSRIASFSAQILAVLIVFEV